MNNWIPAPHLNQDFRHPMKIFMFFICIFFSCLNTLLLASFFPLAINRFTHA